MLANVLTSAASWNSEQSLLTYAVPSELQDGLRAGQLVAIPYGDRLVEGIVWSIEGDGDEGASESVPREGDYKDPHPTSASTSALTMTTDGLTGDFGVIVRAGVAEVGVGTLVVALERGGLVRQMTDCVPSPPSSIPNQPSCPTSVHWRNGWPNTT